MKKEHGLLCLQPPLHHHCPLPASTLVAPTTCQQKYGKSLLICYYLIQNTIQF